MREFPLRSFFPFCGGDSRPDPCLATADPVPLFPGSQSSVTRGNQFIQFSSSSKFPLFSKEYQIPCLLNFTYMFQNSKNTAPFLYFWGFVSSDSHAISTWQSNQCHSDNFRWNSKLIQRNVANGLDLWPDSDNQLRCNARGTDKLFMLRPSLDFHQWRNHNRKFSYFFLPPPPSMKVCDLFFLHKNRPP